MAEEIFDIKKVLNKPRKSDNESDERKCWRRETSRPQQKKKICDPFLIGKGPSNRQAVCSRGRAQRWRSFVAQSFLFLFSATQEDRLSPSSEGGRGPEQLISVQASQ